jgi:hypothetical protein
MNAHERAAWRDLLALGARRVDIGGKPGLDLSPIRVTSARKLQRVLRAFDEVVGRSGANRRHQDRQLAPVFVVTDDPGPYDSSA